MLVHAAANADTIQHSAPFSLSHSNGVSLTSALLVGSSGSKTATNLVEVPLPKFDPALGSLHSVTIQVSTVPAPSAYNASLVNTLLGVIATYQLDQTFRFTVNLPNASNSIAQLQPASGSQLLPPGTTPVANGGPALNDSFVFSTPSALASFVGAGGSFPARFDASDFIQLQVAAGLITTVSLAGNGQYAGTVTVTYDYTPAPVASGFANPTAILIPGSGSGSATGAPASLYSSDIVVSGLVGKRVRRATVTLNNFSHESPDDVDILLVGPGGQAVVLMSDVGGGTLASGLTLTFNEQGQLIPDEGPLAAGAYRASNVGSDDLFPAPAPAGPWGDSMAVFNNGDPNGTWRLFVVDDSGGGVGNINGGWRIDFETESAVVISEFRLRGPNGSEDEFVELYNPGDEPYVISSSDGSGGWSVAGSDGAVRFVIPNGTVIPPRGHHLAVNSDGYSLGSTGDATFTNNIPDDGGIALFNTTNSVNFNFNTRIDAAGYATAPPLYRLGSGLPAGPETSGAIEHSFVRDTGTGTPQQTGSNIGDFIAVSTSGTNVAGLAPRLGAPGPQNLASPRSGGIGLVIEPLDPLVSESEAPNRIITSNAVPSGNGTFGSYSLRRRITNNTGTNLTYLGFRIADITTLAAAEGAADLRALSSSNSAVTLTDGSVANVQGTQVDAPPTQPLGGGWNSVFVVPGVNPTNPFPAGATIEVEFLFGIEAPGDFYVSLAPETLPGLGAGGGALVDGSAPFRIAGIQASANQVHVTVSTLRGRRYRLEQSVDLNTGVWTPVSLDRLSASNSIVFTNVNALTLPRVFYRARLLP